MHRSLSPPSCERQSPGPEQEQLKAQDPAGSGRVRVLALASPLVQGSAAQDSVCMALLPDLVLEQIFEHLSRADLAAAGRVCRRWQQLAGHRPLQARCLVRSFPPQAWQQWQAVLASGFTHRQLAAWAERRSQDTEACTRQSACTTDRPGELLHALVWRLVNAEGLTAVMAQPGELTLSLECQPVALSPDGQYMAMKESPAAPDRLMHLELWQRQLATGWCKRAERAHGHSISCLFFGADSRYLWIVESRGRLTGWAPDSAGLWQPAVASILCHSLIHQAACSPDRRSLAIESDGVVSILRQGASRLWKQECRWAWRTSPWRCLLWREGLVQSHLGRLFFSHDGRQLLLSSQGFAGAQGEVLTIRREKGGWREQGVSVSHRTNPLHNGAVMSPDGSWLVLVSLQEHQSGGREYRFLMTLWRSQPQHNWFPVISATCWSDSTTRQFPQAFSPDGQHLACPHRQDATHSCLAVFSAAGRPAWSEPPVVLNLKPPQQEASEPEGGFGPVRALEFSITGRYLAALCSGGLVVWQRDRHQQWQPLHRLWNTHEGLAGGRRQGGVPRLCFSPDGHHWAEALGERGEVCIRGPAGSGQPLCKMRWVAGRIVRQLQFTPDATGLLVSTRTPEEFFTTAMTLLCLDPVLVRQPAGAGQPECRPDLQADTTEAQQPQA